MKDTLLEQPPGTACAICVQGQIRLRRACKRTLGKKKPEKCSKDEECILSLLSHFPTEEWFLSVGCTSFPCF